MKAILKIKNVKICAFLGALVLIFCGGAFAEVVKFPLVQLQLDVPSGWTYEEQKETFTIKLVAPENTAIISIGRVPSDGASAEEAAEFLSREHGGTKPKMLRANDDSAYLYTFNTDGIESTVIVMVFDYDVLVVSTAGSHPQMSEILDSFEPIGGARDDGIYELRGDKLYRGEKPVNTRLESREIDVNGSLHRLVCATDEANGFEVDDYIGIFGVMKGDKIIAQITITGMDDVFGNFIVSPAGTRVVMNSGTSPLRTITVYALPGLEILADGVDGYVAEVRWDGEDRFFFQAEGKKAMLDIQTGEIIDAR